MEAMNGKRPLIMIVEDNPMIVEFVQARLRRDKMDLLAADSCAMARALLHTYRPDLLLLDAILDDGSGCDLCRFIRAGGDEIELAHLIDLPILFLTTRADEQERLLAFQAGVDDCLPKPFHPDELVYRIQALLRRSIGVSQATVSIGALQVDPRSYTVSVDGAAIDLTPKEFGLLYLLASKAGKVFSRQELFERVWGCSFLGNTRTVDVHINRLRQKLSGTMPHPNLISTEWGVGYKLLHPSVPSA